MPKRVDHDQRRRQIGDAVLSIASGRGLQAVTLREVAVEAGVSLRLVQYYFDDKAELLQSALGLLGEQMAGRLQGLIASLGADPGPSLLLRAVLVGILPTDQDSERLFRAYSAFSTLILVEPHLAPASAAGDAVATERFLTALISSAQDRGLIDTHR